MTPASSQMLKSSGAVGAATLTSRVLGLVREMAYAAFMGEKWVAGAFLFAFVIPNLFRRLLGEGALTAAFIPIFKEKEKLAGEKEMWRAANAVVSGLAIVVSAITVLAVAIISIALWIGVKNGQTHLMLQLLRIMFPYVLLVCLAAIFMGMLNARGHFFVPAMGASLLNVVMIGSVFLLAPRMGPRLEDQIFGLAIGVLIAGFVQAAFQLPLLNREGFRYVWISPWKDETVLRVARQMIPAVVGVAAYQVNVLVTYGIAFKINPGIVASFNYAVRLMELPQGLFGISLATYLLPALSGLAAEKKFPEFRRTLGEGLGYLAFLNSLASVLLIVLAEPIVRLLYERREFDEFATARTSLALAYLAPGLVAFSMVNILARAFYALTDTRTPMRIALFCLTLNILLTFALIWRFRQAGLGMANTITGFCNMALLLYALRRKLGRLDLRVLLGQMPPILGGATLAGGAAWWISRVWEAHAGHATLLLRIGAVFLPMAAAGVLYYGVTLRWKVRYAEETLGLFLGKLRKLRGV